MSKEEAMAAYVDEMKLVCCLLVHRRWTPPVELFSSFCFCLGCADPGGHAHDGRGGGAPAGPRPVLRADRREEKDHADIRPEHR